MIELKLPELGENIEMAEVSRLLVSEGDRIKAEQSVMELDSEKASFPLPCPHAGRVARIRVKEGDTVRVGQTLLELEEKESVSQAPAPLKPSPGESRPTILPAKVEKSPPESEPRGEAKAEEVLLEKQIGQGERKSPVAAGPATRQLARELGVDLHEVEGSGPGGRINREDVKAFVQRRLTAGGQGGEAPALPDFSRWGPVERRGLNPLARTTAQRLSLAWRMVPHVTQHELADITVLEAARQDYNRNKDETKPKITLTSLAIQAALAALKAFPRFNSSLDPVKGELIVKNYYHIGVAVDTEEGLLVPVLRDADKKTTVAIAGELAELAEKARNRTLTMKEMEGGTFTITNLGGIGGTAFTPIVNYPEVAILGIGRASLQLVPLEGKTPTRLLLPLSLSYDHRVINGADGARFIGKVAELLSNPFLLLMES